MMHDQPTPTEAPVGDLIDAGDRFRARAETEGALARAAQPETPPSSPVPPTRPEGQQVEPYVVEGEIVTTEGRSRWVTPAVRVDRDQARRVAAIAGRAVLRTGWQVGQGHLVWLRRLIEALTYAAYREQIRAARARGDVEALAEWMERYKEAKQTRWERILRAPRVIASALVAALLVVVVLTGVLLVIGVAVHLWEGGWTWSEWWATVGAGLSTAAWLAQTALIIGLIAAPVGWVLAAYRAGASATPPAWATTGRFGGDEGREIVPTDASVLEALRHLGIPKLDDAFRRGWAAAGSPMQVFEQPVCRDGRGWRVQIRLPQGVNVEMIARRRDLLAHNLVRLPVEVWPTEPRNKPGVLDLWIADSGSLTGPVPPWPVLADLDRHVGDYFKGVPVGVSIRGDTVRGRLSEANYAVAGMMGSGKSSLVITLLLGALLDPLTDADVFVMAENADYEPMRPRLRSLVTGAGDDTVEACMATLREAYTDLDTRGRALREHDARAVTRDLAERDERLRPRIIVVDECQALFMHEQYGEEAADLTSKLIAAARKYAYTLVFVTPEPSTASLPRRVMAVTSCKACFAIGDQQSNDAVLGTGSYKAGISAVGLTPRTEEGPGDVGTAMTRGIMATPGLLRCFFVDQQQAHRVVARAMQLREQAGITTRPVPAPADEERDLLADVAEVLGGDEVRAARVPALLAKRWPTHRPYRELTGKSLVAQLADLGVKVPSTGNTWPVRPKDIQQALARRRAETEATDAAESE